MPIFIFFYFILEENEHGKKIHVNGKTKNS